MELSRQKTTEAKKLNVTAQYLVMADLMAIGYSEQDAYIIAFPENLALSEQQNKSIRKNIMDSAKFKKLLANRRSRLKEGTVAPVLLEEVQLAGTEEVLKEILRSAKHQPIGSKERAELFAKYNDIKAKNDQGSEDEMDYINFFLPVKCNQCPLFYAYNEYLKENNLQEVRPVEMGRIMSISQKIIQAAIDAEE